MSPPDPRRGIPRHPLYYTPEQVASFLAMSLDALIASYLWYDGRDVGVYRTKYLRAVNLRKGQKASDRNEDWRVAEGELLRWLHYHDLWVYDPLTDIAVYDIPVPAVIRRKIKIDINPNPRQLGPGMKSL